MPEPWKANKNGVVGSLTMILRKEVHVATADVSGRGGRASLPSVSDTRLDLSSCQPLSSIKVMSKPTQPTSVASALLALKQAQSDYFFCRVVTTLGDRTVRTCSSNASYLLFNSKNALCDSSSRTCASWRSSSVAMCVS